MSETLPSLNRRRALGAVGAVLAMAALPAGASAGMLTDTSVARAPDAISPACGPQLTITIAYAFGLTGSPQVAQHTHAFSVTLTSGTLVDGQTVTVDGATSGVLEQFPQHTHTITNARGVLGTSCSFVTDTGSHTFTLHAADFVVPS